MNVLIVSALGETTAAALRLILAGHEVRYFVYAEDSKDIGKGLVPLARDWRAELAWADLVWIDDVRQTVPGRRSMYGGGEWAQEIRKQGKPVLGGSPNSDRLENDRMYGQEILRQHGIPTVPMHRFTSFNVAMTFVERMGGGWAVKHQAQVDRNLNAALKKPDDVLGFLDWQRKNWNVLAPHKPVDFVLQETVDGVEMAMTAFFNGARFLESVYLNQEQKKLMDGGEGPSTGQMGEMGAVRKLPDMFTGTLGRLEPWLAAEGYHGFIDLNCILTPSKVVPLEFTCRPGYPTIWSVAELLDSDFADFLLYLSGAWKIPPSWSYEYVANVVVASGTWPEPDERKNKGLLLRGVKDVGVEHVHLLDVQLTPEADIVSAGVTGMMCAVTARGDKPQEAAEMCYEIADKVRVTPYRIMRKDIGMGFEDDWERISSWGWVD